MIQLKIKIHWIAKILVLAAVLWIVFILAGWVLRQIAIAQIAELTNAKTQAKSVNFNLDGSVLIKNLVIAPHAQPEYDNTILTAEIVYARFGIASLLMLNPQLKEITISDFVFNAQHDLDTDRWNVTSLKIKSSKAGPEKAPHIHLERGTLKYSKVSKQRIETVAAVPLDAGFKPDEKTRHGYSFNITTAERAGFGKSTLTGSWQPGCVTISGGISSADVPSLKRTWTINTLAAELNYDKNNAFSLKLQVKDLVSTHTPADDSFAADSRVFSQKAGSFTALQKFFSQYRPAGQVDIKIQASGNLRQLAETTLVGKLYCKDVSICYYRFPYLVKHLTGQIDLTENSAILNNLTGSHGDTKLFFNGWSRNFGANWKYQIRITSDNMLLDDDLYNALGTKSKRFWSAFSPTGRAAIDYQRSRLSQTDKKWNLAIELLNAEAIYHHFPYPLKNLTGKLFFDSDTITVSDVVSRTNSRKININGKVTACRTNRPIYDISIAANDVPLDSTLAASLSDRQRYLYNQLNMSGRADAEIKVITGKDQSAQADFIANVSLKQTSLTVPVLQKNRKASSVELERSPVIHDVSAKTVITRDLIRIEDFIGRYSEGLVSLTGRIAPAGKDDQLRYCLSLDAEQIRLNDNLFGLLPAPLAEIVSKARPTGRINCHANLNRAGGEDCPAYSITVDCLGNSINPSPFPYPLKDVTGQLTITTDTIELKDITATIADDARETPTPSKIKINGHIALANGTLSSGTLTLSATDILLDERLNTVLPQRIRDCYTSLSPAGRFDLDLENVKILKTNAGEKYVDFDGTVNLKNCNFNVSPPITELNAVLKTKGSYKTGDWFQSGQAYLLADQLRIKGKSLTTLKAAIYYDPARQNWMTENLTADCYNGKLTGKLELKKSADSAPQYLLQVGFDNVDLQKFLSDTQRRNTHHNGYTSGRMNGSLSINAAIGDTTSRIGRCRLHITDMKIGKLSPLAKLLTVLKLTEPGVFAFEQMVVDSYIKRNRLLIQQFDLSGETLAFNGSGWMDLKSENINLLLTARGTRLADAKPSLLQSLTEGLGHAVVRMEVTGNVYDPQVTTKTLPVIQDSLEILGTPR